MLNNLLNGFKVFVNKKTPLIVLLFAFSFFGLNYLSNVLFEELAIGISLKEYPSFLVNYYRFDLFWFILAMIGLFFLSNLGMYLIANSITKSNKKIKTDVFNCLTYTILTAIFFLFIGLIGYFSVLPSGYFSIIMLIILGIIALVVSFITFFGILFLPVSNTIKDSLRNSWGFIKKRFWAIILMIIILGIINVAISYAFEIIYTRIKDSEIISLILFIFTNTIITMYTTSVFSSFIKKKK
jgi:hypothetical protein